MRADVETRGLVVDGAHAVDIEVNVENRNVYAWLQLEDGRTALWQLVLGGEPGRAQHGPCVIAGA